LSFLIGATTLFRCTELDLKLAGLFYNPELTKGFDRHSMPWYYIAKYGEFLPHVVAVSAALMWLSSFFWKFSYSYRKKALFVLLLILIAPVIIVNGILKKHMGRPRPSQVKEFNLTAQYQFVPVLSIGPSGRNSSFPCGHAAGSFCMVFPYFLYIISRRKRACAFLIAGFSLGFVMGLTRMIQGRHFGSDVLWSAAIVYFSGVVLYYILGLHRPQKSTDKTQREMI